MIKTVRVMWDKVPDAEAYPFALSAVKGLHEIDFSHPLVVLVGENGSGKSTLLEAIGIAQGCSAEGGSRNFRYSTADSHSALHDFLRVGRDYRRITDVYFYRAETHYNLGAQMRRLDDEPSFDPPIRTYYGGTVLHELSHGQSVIALLRHRFKGGGLYIMDEPEAALSPTRQLEMMACVHRLIAQEAQFIVATHSPLLMAMPGAVIYELSETGVRRVDYDEVAHVSLYRRILRDPTFIESMLNEAQADDESGLE
jgi:predicted ATPase